MCSFTVSLDGQKPAPLLTAQEKKVLILVAEALSNKEIANELGLSPLTVKRHLENILRKLHLKNRVEAAIYALSIQECPLGPKSDRCPLESRPSRRRGNGQNTPLDR